MTGAINAITNVINNIINLFGGSNQTIPPIPSLTNPVGLRVQWMEISNDTFAVPKTFIGVDVGGDWMLSATTESVMSATQLMTDFHGKELATRGNQTLTYKNRVFKFCSTDFLQILNSNVLQTPDAQWGKFEKLDWDIHQNQVINVSYKVFHPFLLNLSEQITIDGTN